MKILLVEDDITSAEFVSKGLRELGFSVDLARDGLEGITLASERSFEVIILDRMLPKLDGLSVLKALRSSGLRVPTLMLTALGSVENRVEGLESGADDYLVKPFSFSELVARVQALARRPPLQQDEPVLRVGDLSLDRLKRTVYRGVREIELQRREFQLLEMLMLNVDRIVTRTMLLEQVWDFHFDPGTNIVDSHISRIRSKLGGGTMPPIIQTVRGAGYVIRAS